MVSCTEARYKQVKSAKESSREAKEVGGKRKEEKCRGSFDSPHEHLRFFLFSLFWQLPNPFSLERSPIILFIFISNISDFLFFAMNGFDIKSTPLLKKKKKNASSCMYSFELVSLLFLAELFTLKEYWFGIRNPFYNG